MKIAIVVRNLTRAGGGLEQHALLLVRGLARRGHEVHVFAQSWDPAQESQEPVVHFHHVPAARKPAWLQALMFHRGVNRRLAPREFDAVMGSGLVLFAPQHVYRLSGGLMREWLALRHPNRLARWLTMLARPVLLVNWWLERRLLNGGATHVVANSRRYADQAIRHYGIPADRVSVIYNGVDPERFNARRMAQLRPAARRRHGIPDDGVAWLFVAHNFKLKGLELLIRVLPAVLRKNPKNWLVIVGKDRPSRFRRLAARLGIDRRVVFAGASDAIEEYYALADAVALPTRYDPFANVCLEAMACGLPVVTSRINGASELITDGVNGYVIDDPGEAAALADRMCRLLDPAHRAAMGRRAAEAAASRTVEHHLDQVEQLFRAVQSADAPARALRASLRRPGPDAVVNGDYEALLEQHRLHRFEMLMGYDEGTPLKNRKGKQIFQIRLDWNGAPVIFYLKRHRLTLSWPQRAARLIGRPVLTEGRREWENILSFHDRRLPTVTPVAMGERLLPGGIQESVLLTRGLDEYESLERLAPKRFVPPLTRELLAEKRRLIRAAAELTGRMHWFGFYHRDYYLGHLLLRRGSPQPDLRIIDLQRILRYPWLGYRWRVKDIASLHYHALHIDGGALHLTRTDQLRFLAHYRPSWLRNRQFMRAVRNKTARIARHVSRTAGRAS
ncbi:MAG: glycosyltransferase [Nitrospirota bacterium]